MTSLVETVIDQMDAILQDPDIDIETAVSRVPEMFGQSIKATYFGLRSLGLTGYQALHTLNLEEGTLQYWQQSDPSFVDFERQALPLLQKNASVQLLRLAFLRNMTLFVLKDWQILAKFHEYGPDVLSDREWGYVKTVRKHYTPSDLLAIEKAVNPEAHNGKVEVNLTWGSGNQIIDAEANIDSEQGDYYELGEGAE